MGEIVERSTGKAATDYIEEMLFVPLGVTEFEWPRNGKGQAHLGGGLLLKTADLAKFGELQRLNGDISTEEIFTSEWAAEAVTAHADIPNTPFEYGYLWCLQSYDVDGQTHRAAAMSGNGGNRVFILPDHHLTVVFTNTDYNTRQMHQNADAFFQTEIVSRLGER